AIRRCDTTGGVVLLHAGSQGRTSESTLERVYRDTASGCLRRLRESLRRRAHPGSGLLGACSPEVLRSVGGPQISGCGRGDRTDRETLCHRRRNPWTTTGGTTRGSQRAQLAVTGIAETMARRDVGKTVEKIGH